ncbi:hypothetical protein E2P81_ATG07321 [Venturia nashicola]|nr:hypothetical protein E2P81_ATG07321 [Venturia nashicola]
MSRLPLKLADTFVEREIAVPILSLQFLGHSIDVKCCERLDPRGAEDGDNVAMFFNKLWKPSACGEAFSSDFHLRRSLREP